MIATMFAAVLQLAPAAISRCELQRTAERWQGRCPALIEGADAMLSLAPAASITSGAWRRDAKPAAVWAGTIASAEVPANPVEIELYADRHGAMRTAFGWFRVAQSHASATTLRIDVDAEHEVAPSTVDREIVERASRILADERAWNRADNRRCPDAATTWSIYCAMQKATVEAAGAFHHRRPALQVVRAIVDERTAGRPYDHRLMDYNNDPTTRLADVRSLFAEALRRIDAQGGASEKKRHAGR